MQCIGGEAVHCANCAKQFEFGELLGQSLITSVEIHDNISHLIEYFEKCSSSRQTEREPS